MAAALALGANTGWAASIASLPNHPINSAKDTSLIGGTTSGDPLRRTALRALRDEMPRDTWHPVQRDIPPVPAGSVAVTNCNDSGAGSLRDALMNVAVSGDTIDLTNTGCSVITLTTGIIPFFQDDITLTGPGNFGLTVSGDDLDGVLFHGGTGTLEINGLTLRSGLKYYDNSYTANARGGCISSSGFVSLNDSAVKYCSTQNTGATYGALGGGIYAGLGITVSNSAITGNDVIGNTFGRGGGIYTPGNMILLDSLLGENYASSSGGGGNAKDGIIVKYSTIRGNAANTVGGVYSKGNAVVQNTTISGNVANQGGGLWLNGDGATTTLTIINSTISGNTALSEAEGGIFLGGYDARIANSTIAFNRTHNDTKYGAGLRAIVSAVELQSTIIAGNTNDSGSGAISDDVNGGPTATLSGANNLIGFSLLTTPGDTISEDPQLKELSSNGGSTQTHALNVFSPAIEAGNNAAGASADQRGSGFPRVIGASADIGAYEFDLDDLIFADDFE